MGNDATITLRLPIEDITRADELVPYLERVPALRAARVSRSLVLRLALATGLDALEKQYTGASLPPEPEPLPVERAPSQPATDEPASVFTKAYNKPSRRSEPTTDAGARLREWREGIPLTQKEAAARFGVTQTTWSRYETGKSKPGFTFAAELADETDIPADAWKDE